MSKSKEVGFVKVALVKILKADGSDFVTSKFAIASSIADTVFAGSLVTVTGEYSDTPVRVAEVITADECARRYKNSVYNHVVSLLNPDYVDDDEIIGLTAEDANTFVPAKDKKIALICVMKADGIKWTNYKLAIPARMPVKAGDIVTNDLFDGSYLRVREVITADECARRYEKPVTHAVHSVVVDVPAGEKVYGLTPSERPEDIEAATKARDARAYTKVDRRTPISIDFSSVGETSREDAIVAIVLAAIDALKD